MKNKDLLEEGVELNSEQLEAARIAHCDILKSSIADLEKEEAAAKERLKNIQSEIDMAYKAREESLKSMGILASQNTIAAKKTVDEANDLMAKTKEETKKFEQERAQYLKDRSVAEAGIAFDRKELSDRATELNVRERQLNVRLKNIKGRESLLHEEA